MNGRFFRCTEALKLSQLQRFWCCERAQHDLAKSPMGSLRSLAVRCTDDRNADEVALRCVGANGRFLGA